MKHIHRIILCLFAAFFSFPAMADPVGGPQFAEGLLRPTEGTVFSASCVSGETTIFVVNGDGDGDIDCALFDENGGLIDRDASIVDGCRLAVVPRWTGTFYLRLQNNGSVSSYYTARAY
jgi:hypothetical protein